MSERDDFLDWVRTSLTDAERALHNGDVGPRVALWTTREPVTVFGAWRSAFGQAQVSQLFAGLGTVFTDCTKLRARARGGRRHR